MYKTLILFICLFFSGGASATPNDISAEPKAAVVHPVFYTVNFKVEGYTVISEHKTPVITVLPPYKCMEADTAPHLIRHNASVSPELLLARLTKQIDDQLPPRKDVKPQP